MRPRLAHVLTVSMPRAFRKTAPVSKSPHKNFQLRTYADATQASASVGTNVGAISSVPAKNSASAHAADVFEACLVAVAYGGQSWTGRRMVEIAAAKTRIAISALKSQDRSHERTGFSLSGKSARAGPAALSGRNGKLCSAALETPQVEKRFPAEAASIHKRRIICRCCSAVEW